MSLRSDMRLGPLPSGAMAFLAGLCSVSLPAQSDAERRAIVSVVRIWDHAQHSAFVDLVRHGGQLWCAFREGTGHVPGTNGVARVLRGHLDGTGWESAELLAEEGTDLRDPKLSVTPDGRLMVLMGGSIYEGRTRRSMAPRVAFAKGLVFEPVRRVDLGSVATDDDWLWRVTWHDDTAYGVVYQLVDGGNRLQLVRSADGVHYEAVTTLDVPVERRGGETTLRFLPDGRMLAMIRCEGGDKGTLLGSAAAPYSDWTWHDTGVHIGGPDLLVLPANAGEPTPLLLAGRAYDSGGSRTAIWRTTVDADGRFGDELTRVVTLPSSGDTSYPRLLPTEDGELLHCAYYSSHLGHTAVFLATLRLPRLLD